MSVAVLKQQTTLADYGFRNLYNTPTRFSPAQQARNVEQYMQQRRKENAGIEDIAAPAKEIARNKLLRDGEDFDEDGKIDKDPKGWYKYHELVS